MITMPRGISATIVYDSLHENNAVAHLTQDVALVALPGDVFIDVGWHPERDPSGSYKISVYRETWQNQLMEPILTNDPHEVARQVAFLAAKYFAEPVASGSSD
jgi:hypothetical protein